MKILGFFLAIASLFGCAGRPGPRRWATTYSFDWLNVNPSAQQHPADNTFAVAGTTVTTQHQPTVTHEGGEWVVRFQP